MSIKSLYLLCFLPHLCCAEINSILPPKTDHRHLENCVLNINNKYFKHEDVIVTLNTNEDFYDFNIKTHTKIVRSDVKIDPLVFLFREADDYVIVLREDNYEFVLSHLVKTTIWNPRGRMIVILEADLMKFFISLFKYFVINVVVLIPTIDEDIPVFTYFPYKGKESNFNPVLINRCTKGNLTQKGDLFPNKLPKKWTNTTVRVASVLLAPYTIAGNSTYHQGIEPRILDILQYSLGFQVSFQVFHEWGEKLSDGSYTEAYGSLSRYESEMGIGMFRANITQIMDFDVSFSYLEDSSAWIVPVAQPMDHWRALVHIFPNVLWISLAGSFVVMSLTKYLFVRVVDEKNYKGTMFDCFYYMYAALLSLGVNKQPKTSTVRLVLATWYLFSWNIVTIFQRQLMVVLTSAKYDKQIATDEDLISSNLKIGFYSELGFIFSNSNEEKDKYIMDHVEFCELTLECLNRTAFEGDFATIKTRKLMDYLIPRLYLDEKGSSLLYIFKKDLYDSNINLMMARGLPMFYDVNRNLMAIKECGFVAYWYGVAEFFSEMIVSGKEEDLLQMSPLNMIQLTGIFKIWLLGLTLATLVFLVEILQ